MAAKKKVVKKGANVKPVVRTPVTGNKKEESTRGHTSELTALMSKVNSKFGRTMVTYADNFRSFNHLRRPTGIMQMDLDIGGGFMAGKFNTITGHNQSGKSTLLYKTCAMHQKLYGAKSQIAFVAVEEGGVDYLKARRMGWHVAMPDEAVEEEQEERRDRRVPLLTKEEIAYLQTSMGANVQIHAGTEEETLDVVEFYLRENVFGILWLDSVEALQSGAEAAIDTLEDNPQQARHAQIWTRFMQRYGAISNSQDVIHKTTFIATCQMRSNRKKSEVQSHIAKYLPEVVGTNVNAIKHWRQIDIELTSGEKIKGKKSKTTEAGEVIGKMLKWKVAKGRGDTHDNITGETEYLYDFPTFTKDLHDLVTVGMKYGVIREAGGSLTLMVNGEPDDYLAEVPSLEHFVEAIDQSFAVEHHVRRQVLQAAGKHCSYTE